MQLQNLKKKVGFLFGLVAVFKLNIDKTVP